MQSLSTLALSLSSVIFSYHVNLPVNISVNLQKFCSIFPFLPILPSFPQSLGSQLSFFVVVVFALKNKLFIYLTEPGLSFSTWTL